MVQPKPQPGTSPETLPQPLSQRRNFSWAFWGNAVFALMNWAMLAVLAKLGTRQIVGEYALGFAVVQPISLLTQLNLRSVQATDARDKNAFGDYLALRLLTTAIAVIVTGTIAMAGHYGQDTAKVIVIMGFGAGFDAISDVVYGLLQKQEMMNRIAISLASKGVISLVGLAVGFCLTHSVVGAAFGPAIASFTVMTVYDLRNAAKVSGQPIRPRWDWMTLSNLTKLAFPLGIAMMLTSLITNTPRYFIEHSLGASDLGLFAAIASVLRVGSIITGALGQSATPKLARLYADGQKQAFSRMQMRLFAIGTGVGAIAPLVALVGGSQIMTILYTKGYAHRNDVFVLLSVAGGAGYVASLIGYSLTAALNFRAQVWWLGATAIVGAVACAWLVPAMGLTGAALASCLAMAAQLVGGFVLLERTMQNFPVALQQDLILMKAA